MIFIHLNDAINFYINQGTEGGLWYLGNMIIMGSGIAGERRQKTKTPRCSIARHFGVLLQCMSAELAAQEARSTMLAFEIGYAGLFGIGVVHGGALYRHSSVNTGARAGPL